MSRKGQTVPVPTDEFYKAPETTLIRIRAQGMPPAVDRNGRHLPQEPIPAAPPAPPAPTPGDAPTLASAITTVAATLGVDLETLADSVSFMQEVVRLDATDTDAITALVANAAATNPLLAPRPTMRPNPGQGAGALGASVPTLQSVRQVIAAKLAKVPPTDGQCHPIAGRII
jgi:hypothetical protein